ncbi:NAD-dependent epimerase/dehydratase family protein [Acidobacteriota bacterium]
MNIFITGINGFIASHLAHFLSGQGQTIDGSTSKPHTQISNSCLRHIYSQKLGDSVDESIFQDVEAVIHCAYDFEPESRAKNIQGTTAIAEAARNQGVQKQLFISSLSARPDAVTEYGKAKYEIERYFLQHEGIVIRPGTVLGEGGVFGKIIELMKKYPVLPLPNGGKSQMYLIGIDDLCTSIAEILNRKAPLEFNLYYPEKPTLRTILTQIKSILQRNVKLIPFPASFLLLPLKFLKWLGIRAPIDVDNLKGFIKSQDMTPRSNLDIVMNKIPDLETSLEKSLVSRR